MPIKGVDSLNKKLETMSAMDARQGIGKAIKYVQGAAKLNCSVESGELRRSILTSVDSNGGRIIGKCYTNKKYAIYVEMGTGPRGEADHSGISPEVSPSYSQSPWWIHESQIDVGLAEKYHWRKIETQKGVFYLCSGQPAQPFLYPALRDNRKKVIAIIAEESRKGVKK